MTRQTLGLSHAGPAVTAILVALSPGHLAAQPAPLAARIVPTDPSTLSPAHRGARRRRQHGLCRAAGPGRDRPPLQLPAPWRDSRPAAASATTFTTRSRRCSSSSTAKRSSRSTAAPPALQGPAAVVCRMGDSHAILNTGAETLQWMNFQASSIAGVGDAFDLGDDRISAAVDPVPTFIHARLDRALIRPAGSRAGGAPRRRPRPRGSRPGDCSRPPCSGRPGRTSITC